MSAEVQEVLEEILDHHRRAGRKIAKHFKRTRKGRAGIDRLEAFGVPIPDDFRALYHHYDGAQPNVMWEESMKVFGEFNWCDTGTLLSGNKVTRSRKLPLTDRLWIAHGDRALKLELAPALSADGLCPIVAAYSANSEKSFIAFDSTLGYLRAVREALGSGAIDLAGEKPEIDKLGFAKAVAAHNARDEFWNAYARDEIDWDFIDWDAHEDPEEALRLHRARQA